MKIYFDHQVFCLQSYGGVSRYFVELCRGLRQIKGTEAEVIAPAYINAYLTSNDTNYPFSFPLRFPKRGVRFRPALIKPLFWLARLTGSPNVIHETHYGLGSSHLSGKTPVVTTCHDMIFERYPHWAPGAGNRVSLKRKTFERADAIICVSNNTRNDLLEIYPDLESKVSTVHHGVDHTPAPDHALAEMSHPFLLYVGMRKGYKNFDNMIKALGRSRTLHESFQLVCFGGGPFSEEELQKCQKAGVPPKRIHYFSGSDALLAQFYHHASAFIFPSLYEGFGMPLTEAMVHKCPIACSNASCFPEICGEAAEYFDGQDIESISNAIEKLVARPRNQYRALLQQKAQQYSWHRCATESLRVYEAVT